MARLIRLLRYLVVRALAGKHYIAEIARMYFVDNESPGSIAAVFGLSKQSVRGYIQRVEEMCGGFRRARALVRLVTDEVMKVRSIFVKRDDGFLECSVCGYITRYPERHVERAHPEIVEMEVSRIIEALRSRVELSGGGG